MQFRIADTFTASLAKLPNDQQRAAKTTAFDLQTNIAHPGLSLHRVTGARDPGFWSARVNLDLRIILHRSGEYVVLCYVDSHDDAYRWAERRRLETHPTTGAAHWWSCARWCRRLSSPSTWKRNGRHRQSHLPSPVYPTSNCWVTACLRSGSAMSGPPRRTAC